MLKIEDKSSLLVFRNTKGEKVFYSVSIDSEVKDKDGNTKKIYNSLPLSTSRENQDKLEKIFKDGRKFTILKVNGYIACYMATDSTQLKLFIKDII